jgi:hypothetical protein
MRVGPKTPGPIGPADVGPAEGTAGPSGPGSISGSRFGELLGTRDAATEATAGNAVTEVLRRVAAGELTPAGAAHELAAEAVRTWPAGTADEATRTAAVEAMAEALADDPVFSELLRVATGEGS